MIIDDLFESPQLCPECGGISFSDLILAEKKDACYYKVKASAKVWPSAYASGRLVQCRKKGAGNYGNKSEGVAEGPESKKFKVTYELQNGDVKEKIMIGKDANAVAKYFEFKYRHKPVSVVEQGVEEDWQKANKRDRTAGMSQKAVNAYRRENPGSKLKTAVTTKPSKLKRGSKASKRRKSYCSRSRGQMKMHSISCAKTPDKAICKARRRWNC